jgi:hypothetical protein
MQAVKLMKLHAKWQDDGRIELKEFQTTKQIFSFLQAIFGVVRSQRQVHVMIQQGIHSLVLLLKGLNFLSITMFPISKDD